MEKARGGGELGWGMRHNMLTWPQNAEISFPGPLKHLLGKEDSGETPTGGP